MSARRTPVPHRPSLILLGALSLLGVLAASASAQTIRRGELRDALTELPVEGAVIRAGDYLATTDADGQYEIELPDRPYVFEVFAPLPNGEVEVMRQHLEPGPEPAQPRRTYVFTDAFLALAPPVDHPIGLPSEHPRLPLPGDAEEIDLFEVWRERHPEAANPLAATLPEVLPETIRVGRRDASTCSGNPVLRIETVDLETYAAGVVTSEIGVFRALTTGEATQLEGFKTFAVAAVSYALWFWATTPDASYHLDDTACNQRYISGPYPEIITRAARETLDEILVRRGTTATIDKFEYAASCGRNGTLPEYRTATVSDVTGGNACTSGGWCGHNDCAGHQDNPDIPGSDRCLVRGICQWGTAERSARGDTYTQILGHYQPELEIRDFGAPPPTRLVGFVRVGDISIGAAVVGATVSLDTGESTTTNGDGYFAFESVTPGLRTVTYSAAGYTTFSQEKDCVAALDNWASAALAVATDPTPDEDPDAGTGGDTGGEDTGSPDAGRPDAGLEPGPEPAPDMGRGDLGDDDLGREDLGGAGDLGESDLEDDGAASVHPLSERFSTVGPEGLGDGGCAVAATAGATPRTPAPLLLTLFGIALAAARGRRRRSPGGTR